MNWPPEVVVANATARTGGAIGGAAVVPAFVRRCVLPGQRVLDYGAGPDAQHTKALKVMGVDVTAHDFGANCVPGVHDPRALSRTYDLVFASNVLNVADTEALLIRTMDEIAAAVAPGGMALVNLPASPRKRAWTGGKADTVRLRQLLRERFDRVLLLGRFWAGKKRQSEVQPA